MNKLHYYELFFYHDEDDNLATEKRCSCCIKTEIPPIMDDKIALTILLEKEKSGIYADLWDNLTCIMEISEDEAYSYFDMEEVNKRVEDKNGIYYTR